MTETTIDRDLATDEETDEPARSDWDGPVTAESSPASKESRSSRRALIAAAGGGVLGMIVQALTRPASALATHTYVRLGGTNSDFTSTVINNTSGSVNMRGVLGQITATTPGSGSSGVQGINKGSNTNTNGVYGWHTGAGRGVWGRSGTGFGVYGSGVTGTYGNGAVVGARGVSGTGYGGHFVTGGVDGAYAESTGVGGNGVHGIANNGTDAWGVLGQSAAGIGVAGFGGDDDSETVGVYGSGQRLGLLGESPNVGVHGSGAEIGVAGTSDGAGGDFVSAGGLGVSGQANGTMDPGVSYSGYFYNEVTAGTGVAGFSFGGPDAIAVYGESNIDVDLNPIGWAGFFNGNVWVSGTIMGPTSVMTLDHPLDAANKTLSHAAVSSSEMLNVYSGNVTTDATGQATVALPGWFEALNRDFRYQLTVVGEMAHAVVSKEISGNGFSIKTDKPRVKVSWQVSGLRADAYAKAHGLKVESVKPAAQRGKYLAPREHGKPASAGIGIRRPLERATLSERPRLVKPKAKAKPLGS